MPRRIIEAIAVFVTVLIPPRLKRSGLPLTTLELLDEIG
jgi:hypothetical protein